MEETLRSRRLASCPMGTWEKKNAERSVDRVDLAYRVLDGNKDYQGHSCGIFELKICGF